MSFKPTGPIPGCEELFLYHIGHTLCCRLLLAKFSLHVFRPKFHLYSFNVSLIFVDVFYQVAMQIMENKFAENIFILAILGFDYNSTLSHLNSKSRNSMLFCQNQCHICILTLYTFSWSVRGVEWWARNIPAFIISVSDSPSVATEWTVTQGCHQLQG